METTRPSLLFRIRDRGDVEAWSLFDSIYRPIVHRYARSWGLGFSDIEDVAQHAMAALHSTSGAFAYDPSRGRFRGWLRTVVNNRIRNLLRDRGREAASQASLAGEAMDPGQLSDESLFERLWLQEHLWHCLRELRDTVDERTYDIFTRHVFDEVPVGQVAKEFQVEPGNVYTIKWRLTKQIAERMRFLTQDDAS